MSLMYCSAIIIFMVIVNSNSFENYRIIDPKFISCKIEMGDEYLCYCNPPNGHPNYLNQKFMDPKEFYSTLYNPYFYFFYHSNIFNDTVISYTDFVQKRDEHLKKTYDLIIPDNYSVMIKDEDKKYIGLYPTYWSKRPQFFVVNRQITEYCNIFKIIYMYYSKEVVSKRRKIEHNLFVKDNITSTSGYKSRQELLHWKLLHQHVVQNNDLIELNETVDKKFYKINETEYNVILSLMAFLPKVDEGVKQYLKRYFISVLSFLYINENFVRYKPYKERLNIISKDRVKNLKSPYLMLRESYNCYVIRMINLKVIPFHIDFFKKKYNLFKDDDGTKTIFDEFDVYFKVVEHQKLVGQSSESG